MDLDFDKLLKLAADPNVGKTADSLTGMIKEAEQVLNVVDRVVKIADRAGALPGLVRAIGKKYDVDVETPLRTQHGEDGIVATSPFHKKVFEEMNTIPEKDLKKQFEDAAKFMKDNETKSKPGTVTDKKPDSA